jgi:hypothetical protein
MLPSNEPRFTKGLLPTARLLAGRLETSAARSLAIPIKGSKREKTLAGPRRRAREHKMRERRNAQSGAPG